MVLRTAVVLACCWIASQAHADMLGARLGLDYWQARPSVTAGDTGLAGRFSSADANELAWNARFEHPLPLLPNVAARYQQSALSGQGALLSGITLDQKAFASGVVATQTHALKNIDVTAYYEILDNPLFRLDFGFTARLLRADLGLSAGAMSASRELTVTLPMLFVDAEMAIWGTDTHLFMQGNYSRYQSDRNYDWRGGIAWRVIDVALLQTYLRAGWQHTVVNINDRDHLDLHTDNDGGFVGIAIDF